MTDTGTTTYPINTADTDKFVSSNTANTAGYLTCGTPSSVSVDDWDEIEDGSFRITVDGTGYNVDALDIKTEAPGDMDAVAAYIQAAIRTATSDLTTFVWSTDHFVITSPNSDEDSAIAITTSTGTVGTDISGLATPTWMNGSGGVATQGTSDHNKIPLLDSAGNIAIDLADGTGMATDAAPTADTDIANKKYVDDEIDTLETSTEAGYYMSAVYDNHTFEVNSDTHSVTITCGFRPKFIEVIGNIDGNNITRDYHDVSHALGESFAPSWYNVSADTYLGWENVGANEITSRTTGLFKAENPNDEFCEMRINNITDTGFDLYFVKTGSDSVPFYWKFLLKVQR